MTGTMQSGLVAAQVENPELVDRRRSQIVAAAIKLFGERGYYIVTIKDIAKEAGISTGLIYQYFQNKEDVLLLTLLQHLDQYRDDVTEAIASEVDPMRRLLAAYAACCKVVDASKEATILAYRSFRSLDPSRRKHVLDREREINALLADCVRHCQRAGVIRNVDIDLVCSHLASMAHAWALQSWRFDRGYSVDQYIADSFGLLTGGLLATDCAPSSPRTDAR